MFFSVINASAVAVNGVANSILPQVTAAVSMASNTLQSVPVEVAAMAKVVEGQIKNLNIRDMGLDEPPSAPLPGGGKGSGGMGR